MKQAFYMLIYALLISLTLVGCASAEYPCFHYDAQRTGFVPEDGPLNNTVRWSVDLNEFIGAPPIAVDGRVYVGVWPDMNFVAGEEYYLYCLDAATGNEIWKNPLGAGEGTISGAAIADTRLFVGCMDGRLYCIDTIDGSTLWSAPVDTGRSGGNWYGLSSCPAVMDDTVYVTSSTDGTLHAFDLNGNEVWTFDSGNATFAYSSPAVDAGRVYFAGNALSHALYCIDTATQREVWNATTNGQVRSSPVIAGNTVFVASANRLYAFDTGDGSERWNTPISASWGTPAVSGGYLYLGTNSDSALHCYNAATGAEEWTFTANGKIDTSPVVANDIVYFASNTGSATIYAVDTAGNEVWRYATTNYLHSSPAVSDGTLYIGSDEGNLYAFGEGSVPKPPFPGWSGTVTLTGGQKFTLTPFNNASATYTLNRTSALGALDAAATAGGFNYTVQETAWGPFLYSIDGIAYNETTWDSWLYSVNGVVADVGAADYQLSDGDVVTYWYGGWGSSPDTVDAVVTITVSIVPGPSPTVWNGTVSLVKGQIFTVTPFNNASATYTFNRTSALGALDAAAMAGGFNYTVQQASWGPFLYSIDGIAYNETSWDSWLYSVNGVAAAVGAADYRLSDGDVVTYWYGGWGSSPETADHVLIITADVREFAWEGTVSLTDGQTFSVTPFNNASATYTLNRTSALGALDAAATAGGFNYTVQETAWGPFLYAIGGIAYNETTWDSWLYSVNGVVADVGAADYQLNDSDIVTYWYGAWGSSPATAIAVVNITVSITAETTPTPGGGGGDSPSTSWITVTLASGTFTVTADNSGKVYTVYRQTAFGALDASGTAYTFDDSFYQEYGSLFIKSINGRANEGTKGWMYQVNGAAPAVGANAYTVGNGDEVVFYYSEGMGSTPATSSNVISIRVVIPSSSGGSGSSGSSSSGSSGPSYTGTNSQGGNTPAPSFAIGMPAGAAITLGEWGYTFTINLQDARSAGEQVSISGNRFVIERDGMTMTILVKNINQKNDVATGLVESVVAAISPVAAIIEGLGNVTASLDLNLTGVPADGRVLVSFNRTPDAGASSAFRLAAAEDGKEITAVAYTMSVTRINLENGDDITGATIRMTVSPGWVEEHGGVGAVRIVRSAEDGATEILNTRIAGTDDNGNLIVEAFSPNGLSVFGLIAVTSGYSAQESEHLPAAATADEEPVAAAVTAGSSLNSPVPLIVFAAAAVVVAGAAYYSVKRRNEKRREEQ